MISKQAINRFLNRDLDSYGWIKRETRRELLREIREFYESQPKWYTNPFKHQLACWNIGTTLDNFLFFLDMGAGKAQPLTAKILTDHGWKFMGTMEVGDIIFDPSTGGAQTVTGVFPQGVKKIYDVTFSDGSSTQCCADHLWQVTDSAGVTKVLPLKDLVDEDLNVRDDFKIPVVPVSIEDPVMLSDSDRHEYLCSILSGGTIPELEKISYVDRTRILMSAINIVDCQIDPYGKSITFKPAFLMADCFKQLARSLGCVAHRTSTGWTVELSKHLMAMFHVRHPELDRACNPPTKSLVKVSLNSEQEAQCISVSSPEGLYVTDDYIVTHNTKLSLDIFNYRKTLGQVDRMLVVVPNENNVYGWDEEIKIHAPNLKYQGLVGSKKKRVDALEKMDAQVYGINYAGLMVLMSEMVEYQPKRKKGQKELPPKKKKREIFEEHCDWFSQFFDMVVFDEIQFCKNIKSTTTQCALALSDRIQYRYGLTGTPFQEPIDLWSQFYIIDHGETLGTEIDLFYESFYRRVTNYFGATWEFDLRKKRKLHRMIQHKSIRYEENELNDLPQRMEKRVPIVMEGEQLKQYQSLLKKFVNIDGEKKEMENTYIKLRQVSSGWLKIKDTDEETGEDIETIIEFPSNAKLDELKNLVEAMPHTAKMVVFHEFTKSGEQICDMLAKAKIKHIRLWSGTKDRKSELDTFKNDKFCHVAVIQVQAGSTGLNLQHANYMTYYELPQSLIQYKQSLKRIHRSGQKKTCHYYYLLPNGSIDNKILDGLMAGKELMAQVLDGTLPPTVLEEGIIESKKKKSKV